MKKSISPPDLVRKKRERKLFKRYYSRPKNITLIKRKSRKIKLVSTGGYISMENSFICDEFLNSNRTSLSVKRKRNIKIVLPSAFDIFSNTEEVLSTVIDITRKLMAPGLENIHIDHRNVNKSSLGSESLLGLLITEIISNRRTQRGDKINIKGMLPKIGRSSRTLIENIGLVKELEDDHFKDAQDNNHGDHVHYYRKDNRYALNTSVKGDNKSSTAEDCVKYLNSCLNSHTLQLTENARNKLKACLGEVFDNAEEHCGRSKPVWFVRGYFHDVVDDRYLELAVFNLGNSFYENFEALPEDSGIKSKASKYVDRHKDKINKRTLFTIASLQGAVSTKKDSDSSRGHGSVTLIETFESLHDEYKKLRKSGTNAEMNIISGETVIKFDGKYRSKTKQHERGVETFTMPFNVAQSLDHPPEEDRVYTMRNVKFPGVMINIRIPLKGSTVKLPGE